MSPESLHWLGYPAATLTTLAFVPQAWLTLRTRNVQGISGPTYAALSLDVALWLVYGLSQGDWALVIANGITLPLENARMNGVEIRFTANGVEYSGRVDGDVMQGAAKGRHEFEWRAGRVP